MKQITEYEIVDHGIDHEQYFQGCGVAFTDFDDVATGAGNDALEAIDDALEQLAMRGYDISALDDIEHYDTRSSVSRLAANTNESFDAHWYYLSIRVKTSDALEDSTHG